LRGNRRERRLLGKHIGSLSDGACDPAAQRVRDAGGPLDNASYTCGCGFMFLAPVSTNVTCPHCGASQAW
jgi:hypothetical protein